MNSEISTVDEIMIEFGSLTCASVSLETVNVVAYSEEKTLSYDDFANIWAQFRRSRKMVELYGDCSTPAPPIDGELVLWAQKNMFPIFENFISRDRDPAKPYYLCICRENGDEHLVRRSLSEDKFTSGKFMILNCRFSEMEDCTPRNKLRATRISSGNEGEYILTVIHVPGSIEDRDKLRMLLDQYARDGKFALV